MEQQNDDCRSIDQDKLDLGIELIVSLVAMDRRRFMHDRIETGMFVGGVVNSSNGTIWLDKRILACEQEISIGIRIQYEYK